MTDLPPQEPLEPVVVPVIDEAAALEEARRLREIEIAENDAAVQRELKRLSRRGFITLGAGALATYGAWKWLLLRPRVDGVEWPLRRAFGFNEGAAEAYFR